ncbi:Aldo/keto reductase [Pleurotus eryngii]|uniref:Aldo/keto reductase n=1 Tax=Pleurotus eryngii TaxID=5323 RepID=A0A9P6DE96_PLEER|nr:Aldo/keto reductase [Pleurotus eryngii]
MYHISIIYGTAWKQEWTAELVVKAIQAGFRALDTACQPKHYKQGYREDAVGEALSIVQEKHGIQREDLFIQTKFTPIGGQDTSKPLPYDPSDPLPAQIKSSFLTSLANLRTTYIDSYLLHSPLSTKARTLEAWRTLIGLQDAGKVRMIGVSNVYDVDEREVQVVQNRWYEGNGWDKDVYGYCRAHGILYQSFWTLWLAAGHCTPEQAIFRLAMLHGVIPLSGTKSEAHMKDDLGMQDIDLGEEAEMTKG